MGPWYIRDPKRPHRPGCSYETLVRLVEREQIDRFSIIRGPTTRQFWAVAKRVPGVAHLLGYCHNCDTHVEPSQHGCPKCGVSFGAYINRNYLGLPDIRPMPWEAELDLTDQSIAATSGTNGNGQNASVATGFAARASAAPPARNVGISSFATDEELTSPVPARSYPPSAPQRSARSMTSVSAKSAAADEPEFVDVPGEEPGLRDSMPADAPKAKAQAAPSAPKAENDRLARSLRAAVMRQRRTIRILSITVFVVVLLSVVLNFVVLNSLRGKNAGSNAPQHGAKTAPATTPVDAKTAENPANSAVLSDERDENGQSVPDEPMANPQASDAAPAQPVATAPAEFDEAMTLLKASADTDRALDDRIADCEKAVALLEGVEHDAAIKPADFADTLKKARNDLERLRLTKFFP